MMLEQNKLELGQASAPLFTQGADHYRLLADAMPQLVYTSDSDGVVDYVNQRWYEFTGANSATTLGHAWTDWLHPQDQERVSARWLASTSAGQPFETECLLRHVSGEYYWHLARALPIHNEAGQLTHWIGTSTNIHSLKQSESTLSTSEQRLKLAQKAGHIAAWELNLEAETVIAEEEIALLFGRAPLQAPTSALETWLQAIHPQDLPRVLEAIAALKDGKQTIQTEFRVIWPDESVHWLRVEGEVINPPLLYGIVYERTHAKATEEALKRSQARYQALVEASGQVIWSWDIKTESWQTFDTLHWWESTTGQSPQAQFHAGWLDVVHAEDRERVRATWQHALATGCGYQDEYRVQRQDGSFAHLVERVVVVHDTEGEAVELVGTLIDVTQQRRAEQEAAANLHLFQGIAETTPDILFLFDQQDQHISYVNHAVAKLLGYSAEQIQSWGRRLWLDLLHPDDLQTIRANYAQIESLEDAEVVTDQFRLRHTNGSYRWFQVHTLVFERDAKGRVRQLLGVAHDVTEWKQTLEALQESNQKIRSILESTSDNYLAIDREWRITYANQHSLKLGRMSAEAVIGQNFWKLRPHLLGTTVERALHTVMDKQIPTEFEAKGMISRHWLMVKCYPSPEGIVIYAQDITERKLAEERFYQLFESAPNGVAIVDVNGKIQLANAPFEQLFGYARTELVGQPVDLLVPTSLQQQHAARRHHYGAHPTPMVNNERDLYGLRKDGQLFPIEVSLIPMTTVQGSITLCMVSDISARKAAEASLRQSEERLRLAAELGRIGFFDHDFVANRSQFSPLAYTVTQYPEDLPITRESWLNYVHPEDRPILQNVFRNARLTGLPSQNQYRVIAPDQSIRWLQNSTMTLKNQEGEVTHLMGVVRDVTEYKEIEATLRRLNQSLEQRVQERTAQYITANKELEAFAYSISHDLRAPLRALNSFSEILLNDFAHELNDKACHYLQRIHHNATQMGLLIDDLLTFSRLSRQSLVRQEIDLSKLVQEIIADLSQEIGPRAVEFTVSPLPPCQADPILLKQVLINLLSNALKYTRKREEAHIQVGWKVGTPPGGKGELTIYFVQDNGVGFDMRYADKLFKVFQRLHPSSEYEGTGIGLAIVQRIVHRHGGEVWAEAEVDKGATLYFYLASSMAEVEVEEN